MTRGAVSNARRIMEVESNRKQGPSFHLRPGIGYKSKREGKEDTVCIRSDSNSNDSRNNTKKREKRKESVKLSDSHHSRGLNLSKKRLVTFKVNSDNEFRTRGWIEIVSWGLISISDCSDNYLGREGKRITNNI